MSQEQLFAGVEGVSGEGQVEEQEPAREARVKCANRSQSVLDAVCLDELISLDHRARAFWTLLERLDLSSFYEPIRAREGEAGRPALDPRMLCCLWLYATSEGIGSARHLARLCERDAPYRWICGGVHVSPHTLSDFRVGNEQALDTLLSELLAVLMRRGVVRLTRVAQDGVRVRASAGAASFRRERSLRKCLKDAKEQVRLTRRQLDAPARDESRLKSAAKARAAQEMETRVTEALAELDKVRGSKTRYGKKPPEETRASTTDPEARVMRMPDGGYRPGYNAQIATDTESRIVVGVSVTQSGSDMNQLSPMLEELERRTGRLPEQHLVDGGYVKKSAIEEASGRGVSVYAPQSKLRQGASTPRRWDDGEGVAAWRERMESEAGKEVYKDRGSTAETVNADLRQWRGLRQLPVRGTAKALCILLWMVLSYDLMRMIRLGIEI
jgi:transposase